MTQAKRQRDNRTPDPRLKQTPDVCINQERRKPNQFRYMDNGLTAFISDPLSPGTRRPRSIQRRGIVSDISRNSNKAVMFQVEANV